MKKKSRSGKTKKTRSKSSTNSFLNIIIIFLSAVIIYLGYSIIVKLNLFDSEPINGTAKGHTRVIHVEVLNGCGVADIADKFTDSLRKKKF